MFIIAPVSQDSRLEPQPSESSPDTNKEMCRTGRTLIIEVGIRKRSNEKESLPKAVEKPPLNNNLDESKLMNHDQAESLMSSLNLSISDLRLLANYYNTSQVKASHRGRTSRKNLEAVLRDLPSAVTEISEIAQPDEVYYCTLLLEASDTLVQHNIGFIRMDRGR